MIEHLSPEQLIDLLENRIPAGERQSIQRHLAECSTCKGELEALASVMDVLSSRVAVDAPDALIQRAVSVFKPEPRTSITRKLASLVIDSWQAPAARLRGEQDSRQLLMSADGRELHLDINYASDTTEIRGQLMGETEGAKTYEVQLLDDQALEIDSTRTLEDDEFVLLSTDGREHSLLISFDDGSEVECPLPVENHDE